MNDGATPLITATRGPIMLIALGVLFAVEQGGGTGFSQTWPALIVLYGVLRLVEHILRRNEAGMHP